MKILLTLDYELFLGEKTGTVENCLITPMKQLSLAVSDSGARFTIFVDANYLYRLNELRKKYASLESEYKKIVSNILQLRDEGHDVQLHIHPHWQFSSYDGSRWSLDHDHYKLSDLSIEEADEVFTSSKALLDSILGYSTTAFRAGGFSTQPTSMLVKLFHKNGITTDSSVCAGQYYISPQQAYDYRTAPDKDMYRFDNDINIASNDGGFIEIPISMHTVSPIFYWKYVATRVLKSPNMRMWGDGLAVKATSDSIVNRLTRFSNGMATIDGYKASLLEKAYHNAKSNKRNIFCVIGHPKLATPYSVKKLKEFCYNMKRCGDEFITISQVDK